MNNENGIYIIILVMCTILGLYLVIPKANTAIQAYNDLKTKTAEVESLKQEIDSLKAKQDAYEKEEKVATKPVYKSDLATADQMSSFGVMFEDVIQSAKYNGLKLRSISYNTEPTGDIVKTNINSEYNVCAIQMQLIGNYMQFRSYFQDIYNYPYLINLDKINITPYANNKRVLIADVTVILYSVKNEQQKALDTAKAEEDDKTPEGNATPADQQPPAQPQAQAQPQP